MGKNVSAMTVIGYAWGVYSGNWWMLASGLQQDPRSFEAAVVMTRWMFPYIGFMSLVALAAGVLNTFKRFALPAATPVLLNLAMMVIVLGSSGLRKAYRSVLSASGSLAIKGASR